MEGNFDILSKPLREIPVRSNTEILSTILWYSPNISKAIVNLPNWSKQGIIVGGDLLDSKGKIISQTNLEDKYTFFENELPGIHGNKIFC